MVSRDNGNIWVYAMWYSLLCRVYSFDMWGSFDTAFADSIIGYGEITLDSRIGEPPFSEAEAEVCTFLILLV